MEKLDEVMKIFGSFTQDLPKDQHVDDKYLRILSEELLITYKSIGPPTIGNESTKYEFVSPFMKIAVASLQLNKILLKREVSIKGELIEYVAIEGNKILLVVVAKNDDWTEGRTQLLIEMKKTISPTNHKLYGCVYNAGIWEFISYSENSGWKYYGTFQSLPRNLESDILIYKEECKEVFYILRGIIKESIEEIN